MLKITIETLEDKVEVTREDAADTEDLVRLCIQACMASGHFPENVAYFFEEIGKEYNAALKK